MRSLILAGGGIKVGFQAGVLQVWLDEAGLTFDHADGASGGCLNLAMYCQGMSGTQMADNWRNLDPFAQVDLNWEHYWRLASAPSLFTLDNFRQRVLPRWGLDWDRIRASSRLGTFNVCNFTTRELEVIPNDRMSEDLLIASVSLPMWFPPVVINGQTYLDSVYMTDANLEEAIRRGPGEFGRPITLRLLQAEVPIHYLINFSRDRMVECVNLGVKAAREWCEREGIALPQRGPRVSVPAAAAASRLEFTEEMKGHVTAGEADYARGAQAPGRAPCMFHLTIKVDDVNRFVTSPEHEARAEGWVDYAPLGGRRPVERGVFNLFTHTTDPSRKQMRYRLFFSDGGGRPFTLTGHKDIHDDPGADVWRDTTTLYTRLYAGHVEAAGEATAVLHGAGILVIFELDFLKQLGTFRVEAATPAERLAA